MFELIILINITIVTIGVGFLKQANIISYFAIILYLSTFFYNVIPAIEIVTLGMPSVGIQNIYIEWDEDLSFKLGLMLCQYTIVWLIFYKRYCLLEKKILQHTKIETFSKTILWIFLISFVGILIIQFLLTDLSGGYLNNANFKYGNSIIAYINVNTILLLCSMFPLIANTINNWATYIIGVIIIFIGIKTGDKNPILAVTCGLVVVLSSKGQIKLKISYKKIIVLFVVFFIFAVFFKYTRAGLSVGESYFVVLENFRLSKIDASGPFYTLMYSLSIDGELLGLRNYISEFYNILPTSLTGYSYSLSENYAKEILTNWSEGMGLGLSQFAEAKICWSVNFVFIHFIIFNIIVLTSIESMRNIYKIFNIQLYNGPVLFVVVIYMLIISQRATSISYLKQLLHIYIPIISISYILKCTKKNN